MKAAIVVEAGQPPVYGDFGDPTPAPGKSVIRVAASSISHLTRARASGTHYSSKAVLPFVPGVDGTGMTEDGQRVYFQQPEAPYGAMAEFTLVADSHLFALPDGISDVDAAAMANPGMSSWAALVERAKLQTGETVLINGATGSSGRLAIQIAKHLGASKVIVTGRRPELFEELQGLGADAMVTLISDREALERSFLSVFEQGVDVVLDYLYGPSAEALIIAAAKAGPEGKAIRFVQIGSMTGANMDLPAMALRSSGLQLMGSGLGSVPLPHLLRAIQGVLEAAPLAGFKVATQVYPLAEVSTAWAQSDSDQRIVLVP